MNSGRSTRSVLIALMILALALGAAGLAYAARQGAQPDEVIDRERGVLIASVLPESPTAEAGVVRGDILLSVNGEAVNSFERLSWVIDGLEAGSEVTLDLIHGDELRTLTASAGERGLWGMLPCDNVMARLTSSVAQPFWSELSRQVREVVAGSPAEAAGLQVGDIIVAVDGEELRPSDDLASIIGGYQPGDEVSLELQREGESVTLTAVLGEHPDEAGRAYLGIRVAPAHRIGITEFEIEALPDDLEIVETAVQVQEVIAGSAAEAAGLQVGDRILAVDGQQLGEENDPAELIGSYRPGDQITLTVEREGEALEIEATLGEAPDEPDRAFLGIVLTVEIEATSRRFEDSSAPFTEEWLPDLEGSALVIAVTPGSPAEAAGLQEGDRITALNGEALPEGGRLDQAIAAWSPGDTVSLTVARAGEELPLTVVLEENPEAAGEAWLGIRYQPLGDLELIREHEMLDMPGAYDYGGELLQWEALTLREGESELGGMVVAEVVPESAAAEVGLQPGDLITGLNGEPVLEAEVLTGEAWEAGESLTLTVLRPGVDAPLELSLTAGADGALGIVSGGTIHISRSGDGDALMTEAEFSILELESEPLEIWEESWAPDSQLLDELESEIERREFWGPADWWSEVF